MDENLIYKVRIQGQSWSNLFTGTYSQCTQWTKENHFEAYVYEIVPTEPISFIQKED